jgi:hypothetical protein
MLLRQAPAGVVANVLGAGTPKKEAKTGGIAKRRSVIANIAKQVGAKPAEYRTR